MIKITNIFREKCSFLAGISFKMLCQETNSTVPYIIYKNLFPRNPHVRSLKIIVSPSPRTLTNTVKFYNFLILLK